MMRILAVILELLVICFAATNSLLYRVSLADHAGALCSDGTPAAYYRSRRRVGADAASSWPRDYVIFLEGGGYCHDVNACDWRCQVAPHLCTAPTAAALRSGGILSDDPDVNPHFHGYAKVDLPYCTGDMYVGRRPASELTRGHSFLGRRVLTAMFRSLIADFRLGRARRVVFAGSSAGGAGVAFNCDRVKAMVPLAEVLCVVDAAFFYPPARPVDAGGPCESIDRVLAVGGVLWDAPEARAFRLDGWWSDVVQELLIGTARFDEFGLESFCVNETCRAELDEWGAAIDRMARDLIRRHPRVGLFMPGCIRHMMLNDDDAFARLPVGRRRLTYSDTLGNWVNRSGDIHVTDSCSTTGSNCTFHC